jgi:hypothetical protein
VFYLCMASWPRIGAADFERDLDAGLEFLD